MLMQIKHLSNGASLTRKWITRVPVTEPPLPYMLIWKRRQILIISGGFHHTGIFIKIRVSLSCPYSFSTPNPVLRFPVHPPPSLLMCTFAFYFINKWVDELQRSLSSKEQAKAFCSNYRMMKILILEADGPLKGNWPPPLNLPALSPSALEQFTLKSKAETQKKRRND